MPSDLQTVFVVSRAPVGLVVPTAMGVFLSLISSAWVFLPARHFSRDARNPLLRVLAVCFLSISAVFLGLNAYNLIVTQGERVTDFRQGRFEVYTGCLQGFTPSTSQGHTPDGMRIFNKFVSYSDSMENGGYHLTEISGGYIHADTWVRMYLEHDVIVRLDVSQHGCPAAPAA
jgi:hypothetical protein